MGTSFWRCTAGATDTAIADIWSREARDIETGEVDVGGRVRSVTIDESCIVGGNLSYRVSQREKKNSDMKYWWSI